MNTVFLSYRYDDANKALAATVEDLLDSHGLRATTGDVLGGEMLTPEIRKQIEDADALVALLTRRDQLSAGGWTTHEFCKNELQHARGAGKSAIALVEGGVSIIGFDAGNEHIPYDGALPLAAFIKLSRTIGLWKQRTGRTVKIQVMPEMAAAEMWAVRGTAEWEYRLSRGVQETAWTKAKARKEPGGLFVFVQVPDDAMMVEVRVNAQGGAKSWYTDATPVFTPLNFTNG